MSWKVVDKFLNGKIKLRKIIASVISLPTRMVVWKKLPNVYIEGVIHIDRLSIQYRRFFIFLSCENHENEIKNVSSHTALLELNFLLHLATSWSCIFFLYESSHQNISFHICYSRSENFIFFFISICYNWYRKYTQQLSLTSHINHKPPANQILMFRIFDLTTGIASKFFMSIDHFLDTFSSQPILMQFGLLNTSWARRRSYYSFPTPSQWKIGHNVESLFWPK